MTILLVDDEIIALSALKKRVDWLRYGFTDVLTAQDAASARALFDQHAIDMLLCDVEMPGESGLALVDDVRKAYPATECVMVTCHAEFLYIKQAMKSGVSDYILKPIDYAELEALLTRFAQKKERAREEKRMRHITEKVRETREKDEPVPQGRIDLIKRYIDEHIGERIYIEDLAKLVHINDQHLMRVFRRETGQSITAYISRQRMQIAGRLLRETDYSISFISDCVGCENDSYFTRTFKRFTGVTPSEYRKRADGKIE